MYKWDKDRGVLNPDGHQVCQLVCFSKRFREELGKLLVKAINDEAENKRG